MTAMEEARAAITRALAVEGGDAHQRADEKRRAEALLDGAIVEALTAPRWHERVAALMRRELRVHSGVGLIADSIRSAVVSDRLP